LLFQVDKHFPHLTVRETLEFAAAVRIHDRLLENGNRLEAAGYISRVVMAMFGLSHTNNTKVGFPVVTSSVGNVR
jgi:ABC-type multidrug transport system ATPase subunit